MKVVFVKNRKGGPYTIHQLAGQFVPVSHWGPLMNDLWVFESETECIERLRWEFGRDNVEVETYKNRHEGIYAIYSFLTRPLIFERVAHYKKVNFNWIFGFGYERTDYSKTLGLGCYTHHIQLPFCKISVGQIVYKD